MFHAFGDNIVDTYSGTDICKWKYRQPCYQAIYHKHVSNAFLQLPHSTLYTLRRF